MTSGALALSADTTFGGDTIATIVGNLMPDVSGALNTALTAFDQSLDQAEILAKLQAGTDPSDDSARTDNGLYLGADGYLHMLPERVITDGANIPVAFLPTTIVNGAVTSYVQARVVNGIVYLSSGAQSNNEANPGVWTFGTGEDEIACTFTNFNFKSDGWILDDDGITALRVTGDARLSIPYKPFAQDFRTTGKTIEIEFAARDVLNYDAVILSCLNQGRGISMTAQSCLLTSEQSSISMQFKEEEHVRVGFVVEKRSGFRRIYCYINGTMSGVVQYPDGDDFSQVTPADISIGSSQCTMDIYCIRVYDNDLSAQQMEDNWIADTQDGALML